MRSCGIVSLLLLASCAPRRVQWQPSQPMAGEMPTAFAVVWAGAPFHVAPDPSSPTVPLMPAANAREPWAHDTFIAVRVIGESNGWATIETLGGRDEEHCTDARPALDSFRLRLHVPTRSLVSVTTREVTQSFDDDTSVRIGRGVPIESLGRGDLYRVRLSELSTVVRLAVRDVGTRYLPNPAPESATPTGLLAIDALRAGVPIVGTTGRVHSSTGQGDVAVYAREAHGSELLVELRPRCASLRVRVPAHVVSDVLGTRVASEPVADGAPPFLEPGARIFWPDGTDAGSITRRVGAGDEVEARGELRCFARALQAGAEANIVLCFRGADVVTPGQGVANNLTAPGE
jgi:hypothetical protein